MTQPAPQKRRIHPGTYIAMAAVMLGGVLVSVNYVRYHNRHAEAQYKALHGLGDPVSPPLVGKLEEDLVALNRGTEEVHLKEMRGKIWVGSLLYTHGPASCVELASKLDDLATEIGDPRLRMIAFSVDSKHDTPESIGTFLNEAGIKGGRWWYLTEKETHLENYVRQFVELVPSRPVKDESGNPTGHIQQDPRVFLIDAKANVRGYYRLLDPKDGEANLVRLRNDIRYLLDHETPAADPESNPPHSAAP